MAIPDDTQEDQQQPQTLEQIVGAAFDAAEAGEPAPQAEPLEIDDPAPADAAAPAPGAASTDPAPADAAAPAEGAPTGEGEPGQAAPAPAERDAAPSSWKREVAAEWDKLPPAVRAEINRRETEYHQGIEPYKQYASLGRVMEQAVAPYAQNIHMSGVQIPQAVNHLLATEDKLRNGDPVSKAQVLRQIAQDYGIDMGHAMNVEMPDPRLVQAQQQAAFERQRYEQLQQTHEQRETAAAAAHIQQFESNPKYPHFQLLRPQIGTLLQSGMVQSIEEAYERAAWMHPEVRQSLIDQQRTQASQAATQAARQRRAQSAASGVKGSAPANGATKPSGNIRDLVAAAWDGDI